MAVSINDAHLIPVSPGNAVSAGWPGRFGGRPLGVTWHWTATWDLATATRVLGGREPERKGEASAHYGVGRTPQEGVHRWVTLEDRSWHAGKNQTLRWDGAPRKLEAEKASRTTVGVEVVHVGYARPGVPAGPGWIPAAAPSGKQEMLVAPWPDAQVEMMVDVGREIVARWPNIRPEHHHGHHDVCPGYKVDVAGFPFARVLRGIYGDASISDVWTPYWTVTGRQEALHALGYDLGRTGVDGDWGRMSDAALSRFQRDHGLVEDGMWTLWVSRAVHAALGRA